MSPKNECILWRHVNLSYFGQVHLENRHFRVKTGETALTPYSSPMIPPYFRAKRLGKTSVIRSEEARNCNPPAQTRTFQSHSDG